MDRIELPDPETPHQAAEGHHLDVEACPHGGNSLVLSWAFWAPGHELRMVSGSERFPFSGSPIQAPPNKACGRLLPLVVTHLRCLILCVKLTGLRDAQGAGEAVSLGASVREFPEEISTGLCRLGKEGACIMWVGIRESVEDLKRTKRQRECDFSLPS